MKYSEMTKKEISNDVFDALPIEVRESKLTINQKKILNVLFNYSTLDKSIENGSFFISNEQLLKEAELEYPTQLQRVLSFLITNKFIERIAGTRSLKNNTSSASTYTINAKELIEYCEKHPQKTTKKGNVSKGNGVKNVTDVTVIDELRKEIELLKVRINKLEMGNSNGNSNKITNVTTDTDIDPEIDKKYNIHVNIPDNINTGNNIPEVINKNKFINNNINVDNTDEIFLSNFMKIDNINVNNSNTETKNLRIEMNEERVNEMNNINNSNETYMNTPTLEEMLETQALDDNQAFNTFSSFKNKETNYSKPENERYQRLFNKCKSQIEIWSKTHEYSCVSMFDAFFKAIQDMNDEHLISVKQWNAAQHYLFQRFNNLRKGYNNYIQKKNKTISSNEVNENNNPRPPRQNDQMEEVV